MATGHGERLSRQQELAIAYLLTTPNFAAAAPKLKVHPNTLRLWFQQPAFKAAYDKAVADLCGAAIRSVQAGVVEAVEAMRKDLKKCEDFADRLQAAQLLLDVGVRVGEGVDLVQRIEE